jgi:hypothetical protein
MNVIPWRMGFMLFEQAGASGIVKVLLEMD